jgi:transcription elongation factor Elf1
MATYDAYEKAQQTAIDQVKKQQMECISCPTCSSQWFVEVNANRYQVNHNVILGQDIPPEPNTVPYKLLQCVVCKDLLEPRILHNTRDPAGDRYDNFLDTLEGKMDSRKKTEPEAEKKDEIPSEKL